MEKLVLFDWGNVLIDSDYSSYNVILARKDITRELKPEYPGKFLEIFDTAEFWIKNGNDLDMFVEEYLEKSKSISSVREFKEVYLQCYRRVPWYTNMVSLFSWYSRNHAVGILSTLCEMDYELLKEHLPMDQVKHRFFSFELGVQKPNRKIYEAAEENSGYSGKQIIFFDDRPDNVRAALDMDWQAYVTTGSDIYNVYSLLTEKSKSHYS